ncbi:Piwi-domain-containing protein [Rhizopogon vinicolor AM-OR11-026]|uniref:Piwi-domain-containing protein n=1 Tax=Rhizopogon vinicolor AM-OR11-026 TaxID=1314800 RepID=A0A1B7NG03_9AGAM|nr:Piwi-domain-containing protein [Rhizopogon vinicolor AM-OR11-026]
MSYRGERGRGGFDRGRGGRGNPVDRGRGGFDRGRGGRGNPVDRGRGGFDSGSGGRGSPVDWERSSPSPSGFRGGDRGGRGFDRGNRGFDRGGRGFDRGRGRGSFGPPRAQGGVFLENQTVNIDTRVADESDKALVTRLQNSQLGNDPDSMPLRPDFGTVGEHIKLRTNFFPVRVPKASLNEYVVAITPAAGTATRRVKHRIFQLAEQTTAWKLAGMSGTVAHDSSAKLISARVLAQPLAIKVPYYDDDQPGPPAKGDKLKEYTLTITFVQEINTQDLMSYLNGDAQHRNYNTLPVISALNLILAAHPLRSGIKVGQDRYFFRSAAVPQTLGGGLEAWKGFYSSVRPAHRQLMVNVNVCTTAFYTHGNLAVQMMIFRDSTFGARMEAFCRSVRVKTTHLGYRKTVKCLTRQTARQYKFPCEELGRQVTVEQYFLEKYKIRLKYPELPLVDVGGQKKNYLPAEVCEILPDQPFRGKLTDEHTANMITIACQPPNVNGGAIVNKGLDELGFLHPGSTLTSFGVSIGPEMAVVPGRILPKPGLKYANNVSPSVDDRASWNLRNIRFAVGARLDKWAVLLIGDGNRDEFRGPDDPALGPVINGFMAMCRTSGMNVGKEPPPVVAASLPPKNGAEPLRNSAITVIRETLTKKLKSKPDLVLVMLSNGDKNIYEGLKHLCDVYLGVATVCVHVAKIRKEKGQPQYFANVALKVNMKMGGVNHKLDENTSRWLLGMPTMVVGMDVTHPGPGSATGTPSIAAVVASVDNQFAQYPCSLEIQKSRKEMITNLKDMMVERLKLFKQHGKILPQRVLVYRDGVSEGQFNIVRTEELPEILKAFHTFDQPKKPYRPKLTIVICGKRHHTRFYPTERKDAAHDGNPKPGTVVDRGVTAVYDFDFFLQAHGGLQGTTRPTHYYVVHDEIGFKADNLQTLTNALSYMFARATKAVSLVSPAYYADVACERGRCYLRKLLQGHIGGGTTVSGSATTNEEDVEREAKALWHEGLSAEKNKLKDTMFYL